jgi:CarD family transcriptional regulator
MTRSGTRTQTPIEEDPISDTVNEIDELDLLPEPECIDFQIGDNVVYPHHGAGQVIKKEDKEILGEVRQYLTIKILHNDMTVMVPCENAGKAGLRRVIDEETVKKVLAVLADDVSDMPKNWNRRFKHNRDKIKTGDIYELAEVVRNLAVREQDKGLSTGEKQMYTRAKKILASEMMYALEKTEDEAEAYLDDVLARTEKQLAVAAAAHAAQDDD